MIKKTFIRILFSASVVLLFILSCDERTPVSSPPPEVAYQLELFIDNDSCNPSDENYFCTDIIFLKTKEFFPFLKNPIYI